MTASIGIAVAGHHAEAAGLLRDAATAMYPAKQAGPSSYKVFDENLHHRSVTRLTVEGELREALQRGEFEVYYQPQVALPSGRPIGAEALIRWHHPTRGMVPTLEFIPVAEDSGLIKPIGEWVLKQALAQLASWDAQRDGPRLDVLAVNISARQLDDPSTSEMVHEVLQRTGIAPGRVSLEVTETAIMADSPSTRRSLGSLEELGLRLAIDDFGTGYSSIAHLHKLPRTR